MAQPVETRNALTTLSAIPVRATTLGAYLGLDLATLQKLVHDLAMAVSAAKASGQASAAALLQTQYNAAFAQLKAEVARLNAADVAAAQPTGFEAAAESVATTVRKVGLIAAVLAGVVLVAKVAPAFRGRRR